MNSAVPPDSMEPTDSTYLVTRFSAVHRNGSEVLKGQIEEQAKRGWRMVTSYDIGGSPRHVVWRRMTLLDPGASAATAHDILPHPGFWERVRRRSFGPWTPEVAKKLATLPVGWFVESYCSQVGYVLGYRPMTTVTEPCLESYSVMKCLPDWRRTLFGDSWIPLLSDELNNACPAGSEIVCYLGDNLFLIRNPVSTVPLRASEIRNGSRTCKLAMWPNWKRLVLSATPSLAPWLEEEAKQGWELLGYYAGVIFLFGKAK